MKIRSLTLKNIGVFEDETISFPEKQDKEKAEIHILTGQNGTGKTTILQALASGTLEVEPYKSFRLFNLNLNNSFSSYKFELLLQKKLKNGSFSCHFDDNGFITIKNNSKITQKSSNYLSPNYSQYEKIFELFKKEGRKPNDLDKIVEFYSKINKIPAIFSAFAYSGYRLIDDQENINIKEKENYNPLENALEFNKKNDVNDYTLNEWLANKMAQRNSAFFDGNTAEVEKYSKGIETLKQIIEQIIEIPIDFKFKNEKLKVVAVKQGQELDFDLLPDGLRSIISWLGDLIMRMDALKWKDDLPIFEREFILFLDEIEVHLHPSWQRKILPVVQKLFKNAQIFITTHSPFIVNSVDGAWIYDLELNDGKVYCKKPILSKTSNSIDFILRKIFDVPEKYGNTTQEKLDKFYEDRTKIMNGEAVNKKEFSTNVQELLALESRTIEDIVHFELEQLGKEYSI